MKLDSEQTAIETPRPDPRNITVQMNLRVPYFYREQLIAEAKNRGLSINRHLINLLVASQPPTR